MPLLQLSTAFYFAKVSFYTARRDCPSSGIIVSSSTTPKCSPTTMMNANDDYTIILYKVFYLTPCTKCDIH